MSSFAFCSMSDSWCDPSVEDLERDLDLMDVDPMFHPDVLIPNPPISIVGRPPDVTGAADAAALADADSEHVGALAEPGAAHQRQDQNSRIPVPITPNRWLIYEELGNGTVIFLPKKAVGDIWMHGHCVVEPRLPNETSEARLMCCCEHVCSL
eukprot:TRINITY_DN162_c0_g1_i10.p1 TRINITY_DN162_c0_g1~~TRINITY_DN162_c0_g1_i10.p1  ORF type:complete len:153 (+),score=41.04 TRINITY_DN162_c0_g1_i10:260-718(+)